MTITVGVLALQGGFFEHLNLLRQAAAEVQRTHPSSNFRFIEVRSAEQLSHADALILPGGESTTIALVAEHSGLLEPLRCFVKIDRKPVWGTCAGLILLSEAANQTKRGGQQLIGGLDVRVNRNHFGRQIESFETDLNLAFLANEDAALPFPGVFIRSPVIEEILPRVPVAQLDENLIDSTVISPSIATPEQRLGSQSEVEVMARLPGRLQRAQEQNDIAADKLATTEKSAGDIVAVREGNVFGTSFHPELTKDARIHAWWLLEVMAAMKLPGTPAYGNSAERLGD